VTMPELRTDEPLHSQQSDIVVEETEGKRTCNLGKPLPSGRGGSHNPGHRARKMVVRGSNPSLPIINLNKSVGEINEWRKKHRKPRSKKTLSI